jgi:hypothetical protein
MKQHMLKADSEWKGHWITMVGCGQGNAADTSFTDTSHLYQQVLTTLFRSCVFFASLQCTRSLASPRFHVACCSRTAASSGAEHVGASNACGFICRGH